MSLNRLPAIFLLLFSSAAFAGSVSVNMGNNAAQFEAGFGSDANAEFQTGFMYNDQGSNLIDAGLMMKGGASQDGGSGLAIGGGVKGVAGNVQQAGASNVVSAIALGGRVSFTPAAFSSVDFVGEFLSSLKITTFGDADRFGQFSFRLELGPPQAKIFIGYREVSFVLKGVGNVLFDHGGYTGVMFSF